MSDIVKVFSALPVDEQRALLERLIGVHVSTEGSELHSVSPDPINVQWIMDIDEFDKLYWDYFAGKNSTDLNLLKKQHWWAKAAEEQRRNMLEKRMGGFTIFGSEEYATTMFLWLGEGFDASALAYFLASEIAQASTSNYAQHDLNTLRCFEFSSVTQFAFQVATDAVKKFQSPPEQHPVANTSVKH